MRTRARTRTRTYTHTHVHTHTCPSRFSAERFGNWQCNVEPGCTGPVTDKGVRNVAEPSNFERAIGMSSFTMLGQGEERAAMSQALGLSCCI